MSEALSQGPESLGPHYIGGPVYTSSEPHLTTLTVHSDHHQQPPPGSHDFHDSLAHHLPSKVAASGLPPFSSFGGPEPAAPTTQFAGNGGPEGLSGRLLDISSWDYYGEGLSGRLLEQRPSAGAVGPGVGPLGSAIGGGGDLLLGPPPPHHPHHAQFAPHHQHPAAHQMHPSHHPHHPHHPHQLILQQQHPQQYRPWESKAGGGLPGDGLGGPGGGELLLLKGGIPTFTDAFGGGPKLPSFQSQFNATYGPDGLPLEQQEGAQPPGPGAQPGGGAPHPGAPGLPSFHTLGPATTVPPPGGPPPQGARYPLVPAPVQAREVPSIQQQFVDERHIHLFHGQPGFGGPPGGQYGHPVSGPPPPPPPAPSHQSAAPPPPPVVLAKAESSADSEHYAAGNGPQRPRGPSGATGKFGESRKKERRKARGGGQGGAVSRADSAESSAQVAAVSSTAPGGQNHPGRPPGEPPDEGGGVGGVAEGGGGSEGGVEGVGEKGSKKKRKRCGECVGCARKDNCGGCAPCRNEKSHQICKMRRCEKLTEKKVREILTHGETKHPSLLKRSLNSV
ncbi:methylcytosine dioxygenase TET-like [Hetaerina americana]|uniref:methylcytosine dioxygenase TET-like n=1 Tax=Hetaerina americana TaxID=62018 RepID=UPI003A7F1166